jgi:hypothetical protein
MQIRNECESDGGVGQYRSIYSVALQRSWACFVMMLECCFNGAAMLFALLERNIVPLIFEVPMLFQLEHCLLSHSFVPLLVVQLIGTHAQYGKQHAP